MYIDGKGVDRNYNKAFELSKKFAEKEYSSGINLLGYCYDLGIGTSVDKKIAFKLYQKATDLGNSIILPCCTKMENVLKKTVIKLLNYTKNQQKESI
jgi:TPR repeat protein